MVCYGTPSHDEHGGVHGDEADMSCALLRRAPLECKLGIQREYSTVKGSHPEVPWFQLLSQGH